VSVTLVIQQAKRMRRIMLSSVVCPLYHIFPHYLTKGTIFGKKLNIKRLFWFYLQLLSETFLILRRIRRDTITNVDMSSCKVIFIRVHYNETSIFSTDFRKITKYQISWKSVQWEPSCSMRTDERMDGRTDRQKTNRQTDMTKLIAAFRNFANAPNNTQKYTRESRNWKLLGLNVKQHQLFPTFLVRQAP
jgi:hypothetical protein